MNSRVSLYESFGIIDIYAYHFELCIYAGWDRCRSSAFAYCTQMERCEIGLETNFTGCHLFVRRTMEPKLYGQRSSNVNFTRCPPTLYKFTHNWAYSILSYDPLIICATLLLFCWSSSNQKSFHWSKRRIHLVRNSMDEPSIFNSMKRKTENDLLYNDTSSK